MASNATTWNELPEQRPTAGSAALAARLAPVVKWVSIAVIVIALILLMRLLPVNKGIDRLKEWVETIGVWGPVIFALVYIGATVLFIPGSAITLAVGATFGLAWGFATVSAGSTIGAALAFLIARYLARARVQELAGKNPKFKAIDQAIGDGGWKIIALLRLSPAIPFNLSNYLFGLTAIRFWPYVLTSWLAMMPGTLMYVYLGYAAGEGVGAAAGAESGKSLGEWILLGVGLLATVVVTVYVTRIAARAVRQHTQIESTSQASGASGADTAPARSESRPAWSWSVTIAAVLAIGVASLTTYAYTNPEVFEGLFGGPPAAELAEAYQQKPDGPTFDHSTLDALLEKHVSEHGWVDYDGLKKDAVKLDAYLAALAKAPFAELGRDEKLALLINAYNAFTLRLILDYYPIDSIKKIPDAKRWKHERWNLGGNTWSLNQIEHEQIRPKFKEPRIHFALVCAAVGCPKLRNEAFTAKRLDEQLEEQTRYTHGHDRWFRFDGDRNTVYLTKLYDWYGSDFTQVHGPVLKFASRYAPDLKQALDAGRKPKTRWLDYDWALNSKKNAR